MSDPNQEFQAPPPPTVTENKAPRATKLIPYAIGLFVIGLIVCVLGFVKVLPGGIGTGAAFAFWGALLFAFSFIPLPQTKGDEEPAMSGLQKVMGIFFEPTRVFRNLRAHPHWLAAFLVIAIVNAAYAAAFVQRLTPERIVDYTMEKMESSPIKPPPEAMGKMKEDALQAAKQPIQRVETTAKSFVGIFVFVCFAASLCLLGVLAFGGRMNFLAGVRGRALFLLTGCGHQQAREYGDSLHQSTGGHPSDPRTRDPLDGQSGHPVQTGGPPGAFCAGHRHWRSLSLRPVVEG